MKNYLIPLVWAGLAAIPCAAQAAEEDQQLWLQGGASVKLGDNWRLSEEVTVRFGNAKKGLYEIENNLLLGYKINDIVTIWAGYTHDPQYNGGNFAVMERRFRQQVTLDNVAKLGGGSLSLRVRTEQRWREGVNGTGWRVRPYAKYTLPVSADGKTTLSFGHESFINLSSTSFQAQTGYDRMRNNVALKFPLLGKLSGEVGYLNQFATVRGGRDRMDHVATAGLSISL